MGERWVVIRGIVKSRRTMYVPRVSVNLESSTDTKFISSGKVTWVAHVARTQYRMIVVDEGLAHELQHWNKCLTFGEGDDSKQRRNDLWLTELFTQRVPTGY